MTKPIETSRSSRDPVFAALMPLEDLVTRLEMSAYAINELAEAIMNISLKNGRRRDSCNGALADLTGDLVEVVEELRAELRVAMEVRAEGDQAA